MTFNEKKLALAEKLWGWIPHASQLQWLAAEAKVKVAACGRRWGKTEAAAVDLAAQAILNPGCRQIVVSPSYDQSRIIIDTVESLLARRLVAGKHYSIVRTPYTRIKIGNSVISARTADENGRNLRGHWADRVIVDEAAYVRDSVIYEVISPMLADKNGDLVLVSTPFGRNHFYNAYLKGQSGTDNGFVSMSFPTLSNPHISSDYVKRQREYITARQFAVEYEAQFIEDSNAVFTLEDIRRSISTDITKGTDWTVAGLDWARYQDYTAIVVMSEGQVLAVDYTNGLSWQEQIERITEFAKHHRVNAILADQTSIGDPLNEQLKDRLSEKGMDVQVEGLVFTTLSKRELIDSLAIALEAGSIRLPEHRELIQELTYYEYELSESGNIRFNAKSGQHDDLVIALALAWKQCRMSTGLSVFSAGRRIMHDL